MTRYDLKIGLILIAIVVALGLALGYGVGLMTRSDSAIPAAPADSGAAAFTAAPDSELSNPDGGTLPGYAEVYVNDYQDLLDAAAETRIRDKLIGLYDRTGIEMSVLTIQNMGQYGHSGAIEPFATALFNAWGIGNAKRNDGVLILIARFDREMRIELGAGYARSYDARMQRVIDDAFLPAFRDDAYQAGIERGVDEVIREITGSYPGEYDNGTLQQGWSRITHWLRQIGGWVVGLVVVPLGGLVFGLRRYLRYRPRPCGQCRTIMLLAGEVADDQHLDGGQKLEEFLKSVDYDVWHCPDCGHMDIIRHKSWFSRMGACPQCSYRTLSTKTTILRSATTSSTGLKQLDYNCAHCHHTDTETRTIPKKSKSSSGSSRSSFGGGSSSGGGASGSW